MTGRGDHRNALALVIAAAAGAFALVAFAPAGHAQGAERPIPPREAPEAPPMDDSEPQGAVLQGLDKVTARISTFEAPLGSEVSFGTLRIQARACHKKPPTEPPESAAFLEIDDVGAAGERGRVFSGWMFASSPALSAMEHPVYDVWVVDCMNASSSAGDSSG